MNWISVNDCLPKLSYQESDDATDPYEAFPVLVFNKVKDDEYEFCVAYLVQNQDKESWNYGEFSWELYVPGNGGTILTRDIEEFTHWMPLPKEPNEVD